jgi:MFS family permease
MKSIDRSLTFAPFRVRSFRFQWPADLLTSWAFEMETLILSWYVMVRTGSVVLLTVFASLSFLGTLAAPMFGVLGDRLGARALLCVMRASYAGLAGTLMVLGLADVLTPTSVFVVAASRFCVARKQTLASAAIARSHGKQNRPPGTAAVVVEPSRRSPERGR